MDENVLLCRFRQIKEAQETQEAAQKAVNTCDEAYKLSLVVKEKQLNARYSSY